MEIGKGLKGLGYLVVFGFVAFGCWLFVSESDWWIEWRDPEAFYAREVTREKAGIEFILTEMRLAGHDLKADRLKQGLNQQEMAILLANDPEKDKHLRELAEADAETSRLGAEIYTSDMKRLGKELEEAKKRLAAAEAELARRKASPR